MKITIFILLCIFSFGVSAHPGHGESGWLAHGLEHGVWLLCGMILFGIVIVLGVIHKLR